jgi:NitT/TauT family transport system substrate-binding protein
MGTNKKILPIIAFVVIAAGVAVGLWIKSWPPTPIQLRLSAFNGDVGALAWIAHDKGFFKKAGLDITIKGHATGKESIDALQAGEVDVATASEFVVATRSFTEPDLRILSSVSHYWNKGLIARRDKGVTAPAELKGKKIGVTKTSTAEHTLMVYLALHGLTQQDVTIVNLLPKQLVEQITSGDIDAALTWQPHVSAIEEKLGGNAVTLLDKGTEAHLLVITRQDFLPVKSEAIQRMLRGLIMAEGWVQNNPEEAKKFLVTRFSLAPAYIEMLWPRMRFIVALPQEILESMDGQARWFASTNSKSKTPNFAHNFHTGELLAIRKKSVTIIGKQ